MCFASSAGAAGRRTVERCMQYAKQRIRVENPMRGDPGRLRLPPRLGAMASESGTLSLTGWIRRYDDASEHKGIGGPARSGGTVAARPRQVGKHSDVPWN